MAEQSPLLQRGNTNGSASSHNYGTELPPDADARTARSRPTQNSPFSRGLAFGASSLHIICRFVFNQWFSFTLLLLILIASQVQVPEAHQEIKKTLVLYVCVTVIFFITGCTLPSDVLVANYTRWQLHLFCQLQSFLLISAMVFGVVSAAASNHEFMDPGLLVGLIFMGCVPTTISSNVVLTKQAGGETALTVGVCSSPACTRPVPLSLD